MKTRGVLGFALLSSVSACAEPLAGSWLSAEPGCGDTYDKLRITADLSGSGTLAARAAEGADCLTCNFDVRLGVRGPGWYEGTLTLKGCSCNDLATTPLRIDLADDGASLEAEKECPAGEGPVVYLRQE